MSKSGIFTKRLKFVIAAILIAVASAAVMAPKGQAQSGETCSILSSGS